MANDILTDIQKIQAALEPDRKAILEHLDKILASTTHMAYDSHDGFARDYLVGEHMKYSLVRTIVQGP